VVGRGRPRAQLSAIITAVFVVRLASWREALPPLRGPRRGLARLTIWDITLPPARIAGAKFHPRAPLLIVINSLAVDSLAYYRARIAKALWIGPAVSSEAIVRSPASFKVARHPSLWVPPCRPRLTPKENTHQTKAGSEVSGLMFLVKATALQAGPGDEENYSDDNESSAEEHEVGE
jgi:hypothetical protein